jgi:hypothetical protein
MVSVCRNCPILRGWLSLYKNFPAIITTFERIRLSLYRQFLQGECLRGHVSTRQCRNLICYYLLLLDRLAR